MTLDAEDIMSNILAILQADLPAKIAAIEAEKVAAGVGLTGGLATIPNAHYYFQSWTNAILNTSPAILYGLKDVEVINNDRDIAEKFTFFVDVLVVDNIQGDETKRILRYTRAIREVLQAKYDQIGPGKALIKAVAPMAFLTNQDTSDEVKVGGVEVLTILV